MYETKERRLNSLRLHGEVRNTNRTCFTGFQDGFHLLPRFIDVRVVNSLPSPIFPHAIGFEFFGWERLWKMDEILWMLTTDEHERRLAR